VTRYVTRHRIDYPPEEWIRDHHRGAGYVTCVEDMIINLFQYLRQQHKKTPAGVETSGGLVGPQ
jgi:hypothetical protein